MPREWSKTWAADVPPRDPIGAKRGEDGHGGRHSDQRPRRKPVDPATAAKAQRIIEEVRTWYRRGQQAIGLSGKDAKDVGQAMQTHSAEVGTTQAAL